MNAAQLVTLEMLYVYCPEKEENNRAEVESGKKEGRNWRNYNTWKKGWILLDPSEIDFICPLSRSTNRPKLHVGKNAH